MGCVPFEVSSWSIQVLFQFYSICDPSSEVKCIHWVLCSCTSDIGIVLSTTNSMEVIYWHETDSFSIWQKFLWQNFLNRGKVLKNSILLTIIFIFSYISTVVGTCPRCLGYVINYPGFVVVGTLMHYLFSSLIEDHDRS